MLFDKTNYDGYFLEYGTKRAGGFEPLRFVPNGNKQIVLGLVTSKSGIPEKKEDIKARPRRPRSSSRSNGSASRPSAESLRQCGVA